MNDSTKQITIDPSPASIYTYQDVVFIDRNVSGCITLAREVKKVVYGCLPVLVTQGCKELGR